MPVELAHARRRTPVWLVLGLLACASRAWAAPDLIPAAVAWRVQEERPFADDPLRLLSAPARAALRVEWAPLYRDAHGARYEWARDEYDWTRALRYARAGIAVSGEHVQVRASDAGGWLARDAGGPRRGVVLAARRFGALAFGAAVGGAMGARPGAALAVEVARGPGWQAQMRWSQWSASGQYDAGVPDARVLAAARWSVAKTEVSAAGPTPLGRVELELAALDQTSTGHDAGDVIEPQLAWRSLAGSWLPALGAARLRIRLEHGIGRSGFAARRDGVRFATAAGGLWSDLACAEIASPEGRLRAWVGRWRTDPGGALSTWPFANYSVLTGTRRYAATRADLDHVGLAAETPGVGVAILHVRPRVAYESWQGTLFGLGRDDFTTGTLDIKDAWLAGLRLASERSIGFASARVEIVQWVPFAVRRVRIGTDAGSNDGGGRGPEPFGGGTTWGGTVVRVSFRVS